jgi:hypothetical protein
MGQRIGQVLALMLVLSGSAGFADDKASVHAKKVLLELFTSQG